MTYTNFPLYVGDSNRVFTSDWGYHKEQMLFCETISINYSSAAKENRRLGSDVDKSNQYVFDNDLTCSLNVGFYLYPDIHGDGIVYSFLMDGGDIQDGVIGNATGSNYFPLKIGGNVYNKCFLDSYSLEIVPFQPVRCAVSFKSYDPPKQTSIKSDEDVPFSAYNDVMSGDGMVYGNTCLLSGYYNDIVNGETVSRIRYQKNYNRKPSYGLGSSKPTDYFIDGVDAMMSIESTGLSSFIAQSGQHIDSDIGIKVQDLNGGRIIPSYDGGFDFVVASGSLMSSQSYSVKGGDGVASSADIKEVIL